VLRKALKKITTENQIILDILLDNSINLIVDKHGAF
jgi:hypothetical protein